MLTKLSSVLETDIHELIYGPPNILVRSKMIMRLCVCGIICVLMVLGNHFFSTWAMQIKTTNYNPMPTYLLNIIYKPIMFCVSGYTFMQCLSVFNTFRPFKDIIARRVKRCIFVIILGYLVITCPLILSQILPFNVPNQWVSFAFMILGALPAQRGTVVYLPIASIIGSLLWMCNIIPSMNRRNDDSNS